MSEPQATKMQPCRNRLHVYDRARYGRCPECLKSVRARWADQNPMGNTHIPWRILKASLDDAEAAIRDLEHERDGLREALEEALEGVSPGCCEECDERITKARAALKGVPDER